MKTSWTPSSAILLTESALFVIYSLHDGVCSLRYLQSSWLILVSLLSIIIMMESCLFVMYLHHDLVCCGPDLQLSSSSSTVIITWWRVIHRNSEHNGNPASSATVLIRWKSCIHLHDTYEKIFHLKSCIFLDSCHHQIQNLKSSSFTAIKKSFGIFL